MTKGTEPPRSHREIAAQIADDVVSPDPDAEYTTPYLLAGLIHAILALTDALEDDPLGDGSVGTLPADLGKHFGEWRDTPAPTPWTDAS